jgi:lantibiotic transport system permease protein
MTGLGRATRMEVFKLRRTLALWASILLPLLVIVMSTSLSLARGARTRFLEDQFTPWDGMLGVVLSLWCLVGLPVFVSLTAALLAGLEHRENGWKHLFALPIERWTIYAAKLLTGGMLLCVSSVVLTVGTVGEGLLVLALRPDLGLTLPVPLGTILLRSSSFTIAAILMLALVTWVAIRWRSFVVALALGLGGGVGNVVLGNVVEAQNAPRLAPLASVFPWSIPYVAFARPQMLAFLVAIVGGVLVAVGGCWELVRRDVP